MMSESCYVMPASFFSCDKDADDFFSLPFVFLSFCPFVFFPLKDCLRTRTLSISRGPKNYEFCNVLEIKVFMPY